MLLEAKSGHKAARAGSFRRWLSLEKTICDADYGDQHHAIEQNIQPFGFKAVIGGWGFHGLVLHLFGLGESRRVARASPS